MPAPKLNHELQISGGRWPDLMRIVARDIFYQMQHPLLLDLFVEPAAKLRAVLKTGGAKEGAILVVDVDDKAVRIQRPVGPAGPSLFEDEVRRDSGKRGILAAGLDADLSLTLRKLCPKARPPIEQSVEISNLDEFDLDLPGSMYKSLRNSLSHAEREGIHVEPYDPGLHAARALKVFDEWNSLKPRVATYWIPNILKDGAAVPGLVSVAAIRRNRVIGVSMALTAGAYAYMLLALTLRDHGRSQELMDYDLMKKLKSAGVRRLDWGISDSGPISAYKKKYGNISIFPISTFWVPAG